MVAGPVLYTSVNIIIRVIHEVSLQGLATNGKGCGRAETGLARAAERLHKAT